MGDTSDSRLILATFEDEVAADEGLARIRQAAKEKRVDIRAAAVVRQNRDSKVQVSDVSEFRAGQAEPLLRFIRLWNGAIVVSVKGAGVVINSVTALAVLGVVRVVGVADMLFGRLASMTGRSPLRSRDLQHLGHRLPAGSTAVVTLADENSADAVRKLLEQSGARVYASVADPVAPSDNG